MGFAHSRPMFAEAMPIVHGNVVAAVRAALHALVIGASYDANPDVISVRACRVSLPRAPSMCSPAFLAPVLSV
eukprot:COSAG02_NODE_37376_length_442_cov_1.795918_1_plen_72_part_10